MQSIAWAADSFTFACMHFLAITLVHNMVIQSRNKLTKFINCLFYGKLDLIISIPLIAWVADKSL